MTNLTQIVVNKSEADAINPTETNPSTDWWVEIDEGTLADYEDYFSATH